MQQYFSDVPIESAMNTFFNKNQAHHAKNVVRLENEKVRIVYGGTGYFATASSSGKDFVAKIEEKDERVNEIGIELTLAVLLFARRSLNLFFRRQLSLV